MSVSVITENEEMSIITSNNYSEYNFKQSQRIHNGFGQCSDTLESLFD